ncbi:outer membrane lipoprotein-sorting protein [Verrucomicrobiota bacterium]
MNKALLPIVLIFCFLFLALVAAEPSSVLPSAEELLRDVRSFLPKDSLVIRGDMIVRKRKGIVAQSLKYEIFMKLGSQPQVARYAIRDKSGRSIEQLTITRYPGAKPTLEYAKGNPLRAADLPDLFGQIQNTDISWTDLSLSFLWWEGGTVTGTELLRGQSCFVVEVPRLADKTDHRTASSAGGQYAKVILWIDKKLHMILQAEGYDSNNRLIRRLWVKSFKKINERWMIKDMEIQSYPANHRTKLLVREVGAWEK